MWWVDPFHPPARYYHRSLLLTLTSYGGVSTLSFMTNTSAARYGLFILTVLNILNYMDRYVVAALVESLKHSELAISDSQAGLLMTSFLIVYMIASPVFGELGDRKSRAHVLAVGVVIWSLATMAGHWAVSFASL